MPEPAKFPSKDATRRFDAMRIALAQCSFLPGSPPKRFARQVAQTPLENISEAQRRHVIRLVYRFRRQMPPDLVPSKDAIEALDAAWNAAREKAPSPKVRKRAAISTPTDNPPLLVLMGNVHA